MELKDTNSACMGLMYFSSILKQFKGEVHTHMFAQFQTLVNIFLQFCEYLAILCA